MIWGFNTAPLGLKPYPQCVVCEDFTFTDPCRPRNRLERPSGVDTTVARNGDVTLYIGEDALTVNCIDCIITDQPCDEITPADARVRLFIDSGNIYARIVNGRIGQIVEINAVYTTDDGQVFSLTTALLLETPTTITILTATGVTLNP